MVIRKVPTPDIDGTEHLYIQYSFYDGFCGCFVSLWMRLDDNSGAKRAYELPGAREGRKE